MDHDDAYANGKYIAGADDYPPRWQQQAAGFRAALGRRAQTGLRYGAGARQTYDLFLPDGTPYGLMVFVHGGYWRATAPADWSHLAAGGVARGWAVALPGYTLCPAAGIADITREVAVAVVQAALRVPGPVVIAGHSAGGHLAARMVCADVALPLAGRIVRTLPISPLADLRPLVHTAMNADFALTDVLAAAESPALLTRRPGADVTVWVGADERPAFVDHARWLAAAWHCDLRIEPGRHHFDVIDDLTDPGSAMLRWLLG